MATQVFILPVLIIIAIIAVTVVYIKTKDWAKVGSVLQIVLALGVFGLATQLTDTIVMSISILLGLGILISGLLGLR